MANELRILIVEDVETDAELAARELKAARMHFTLRRVDTREAFESAIEGFGPDLILSDFTMPGAFDGLTALAIARKKCPDVPFVFVSGTIGEERAVEAMKRGATDYVLKDRLQRLIPVVTRALEEAEEHVARKRAEHELAETKSRLDSILGSLADVVWSMSVSPYRLLYINPAGEKVYGRPLAEFYLNPDLWLQVMHPEDRGRTEKLWERALRGEPFDAEYRVVHGNGEVRWVHDRGQPVRDASGAIARLDGLATDITERKLQEEKIARLNRIYAVLSGINSTIVRVTDRDELFREACRIAVEHGGFKLAWIGAVDRETLEVKPSAWVGDEAGFFSLLRMSAREDVPEGRGVTGTALRSRKPVVVNDVANDDRLRRREETLARGFRALVMLPLVVADEAQGVLALYAGEPGVFDQEEIKLLEELASDISFALDHIAKTEKLDYLAYYDGLTGLPNRTLFRDRVGQLVAVNQDHKLAVALLDLERFRSINETLGTAAGDAILKQLASRLSGTLTESATLSRIGTDHFALALAGVRDAEHIAHFVQDRMMAVLAEPFVAGDRELRIPAKFGIAVYPDDGRDADNLLVNAEAALRKAKETGNRYSFYEPGLNARVAEKLTLENRLRVALEREQFVLHYQPRVDLASGRVSGLEALIRWQSPELGLVAPSNFIPILEETGMILEVGRWALAQAVRDYRAWLAMGLKPPRLAVNVSAIQLRQANFASDVVSAVGAHGPGGEGIEIELTETIVMENIEGNLPRLAAIKEAGMQIVIDDFGTGYSSLSYLAKLPVDALKIDRSFIVLMTRSPEHMAIVSTIISLARSLDLRVTAEGVETEEQKNLLRLLKCDEMQGYLFSPPLPAAELEKLIAAEKAPGA